MSVTPEDVRQVAELARLAIPAGALETYVGQLNGILAHMDVLQRAAAEGEGVSDEGIALGVPSSDADVEGPSDASPLREDVEGSVPLLIPRERFAPSMRDGFFLVPRLASHDDAGAGP